MSDYRSDCKHHPLLGCACLVAAREKNIRDAYERVSVVLSESVERLRVGMRAVFNNLLDGQDSDDLELKA